MPVAADLRGHIRGCKFNPECVLTPTLQLVQYPFAPISLESRRSVSASCVVAVGAIPELPEVNAPPEPRNEPSVYQGAAFSCSNQLLAFVSCIQRHASSPSEHIDPVTGPPRSDKDGPSSRPPKGPGCLPCKTRGGRSPKPWLGI